jgi:starch phosphorylase
MEVGLHVDMPTYSGGLGVLAGDTIQSAADLGLPMIAISLLSRKGYFHQNIDSTGWQTEEPDVWSVEHLLERLDHRISLVIDQRIVHVQCWQYSVTGVNGDVVPVYLLDTDLEENSEHDRTLTDYLYGGDNTYRLCQEIILGLGGIQMLRKIGYSNIHRYHMNEGHSSLLILELLKEEAYQQGDETISEKHREKVKEKCIFTTHTPVPAAHDQFQLELLERLIPKSYIFKQCKDVFCFDNKLNLTYLALTHSRYINGVAKKHSEISKQMFSNYQIDSITNGVHTKTWTSPPFRQLFDKFISGWQSDSFSLRNALNIPPEDIWDAHQIAKKRLLNYVKDSTNIEMDLDTLTLGFARRATLYKHADLILTDLEKIEQLSNHTGKIQLIFAGKAHPHDLTGKDLIQKIFRAKELLANNVKIAYLPNYDIALGKLLTSGSDVWLNTPQPPMEASGTSGMKAALNGVPSFSILDGWWLEGCIEGVTGWSINNYQNLEQSYDQNFYAQQLYKKLEDIVIPTYYINRNNFISMMRHAIAINGSFFNTERMLSQYISKAYF